MKNKENVAEIPKLMNPTEFGLDNDTENRRFLRSLMKKKKTIIEETDDYLLFRTGNADGNIVMYNKQTARMDYWVRYTTITKSEIGKTVTQVGIWRKRGSPINQGITERMFFDYLLKYWPTVMSDSEQTLYGQTFWFNMLAKAYNRGYKFGLVNLNHRATDWFDSTQQSFDDWIKNAEEQAYGTEPKHMAYRFLISNP